MPPSSGRILAIDYGRKRVGFAVTDELQIAITSLPVLQLHSPEFRPRLKALLDEYQPLKIILGFPGSHQEITPLQSDILDFKRSLEKIASAPIELVEESHSSLEAEELSRQTGAKSGARGKKELKKKLDSIAAKIILRRYLLSLEDR